MFVKRDTLRGSGGSFCGYPDLGLLSLSRAGWPIHGGTVLGIMRLNHEFSEP